MTYNYLHVCNNMYFVKGKSNQIQYYISTMRIIVYVYILSFF